MTIVNKLRIFAVVTCGMLGIVLLTVFLELGKAKDELETAGRRDLYTRELVEIKASALSTIMLDPSLPETAAVMTDAEKTIVDRQGRILAAIKRPQVRAELQKILDAWQKYDQDSQALIQLAKTDAAAANARLVPLYNAQFKPLGEALNAFIAARSDEARKGSASAMAAFDRAYMITVALLALAAVVIVGFVLVLSWSLQRNLRHMLDKLKPLKEGHLHERLPIASRDELAQIATGVNEFVGEVQQIVRQVHDGADELTAASSQLASTAQQVALSSSSQADSASSVAAAVEQLTVSVASIADTSDEVRVLTSTSLDNADKSGQSILLLQGEIDHVKASVESIASEIESFIGNTNAISNMTQQVREIADQTNLLALNAAIEAARAGEQGRGFAVVADEVRKLAERSALSAGEIASVTQVLNSQSEQVVKSISVGLGALETSRQCVQTVTASLEQASSSVRQVGVGVSQVASSVQEQKVASADIARYVESIAQMAEENSAASQESSTASARLETLSGTLKGAIRRFTV
ncbi:methyl-accepting chemotaxis protein [Microvirgula aerodenitrificans]|uniref:methyl-accepting chemotaxis protein n=1 Tax=Microvirgula aerodenitrificans TaxID=57480 RepID=UPI0006841AE8|nr:methyl-accepting chemotaxis protein [Microvirgula aerodenitrificans]